MNEKPRIALYLAGNIQKGHEKESGIFWTAEDQKSLSEALVAHELTFLNPASRTDDLSDQKSVFGRDMMQVFFADAVLVDARERRGLGVGAEMMCAKMNRIPVFTYAPKDSHYRKKKIQLLGVPVENWVHPFVESLSDALFETLQEAALLIETLSQNPEKIKGPEFISEAMRHYQRSQLPNDIPMKELIGKNSRLQTRLSHFCSKS